MRAPLPRLPRLPRPQPKTTQAPPLPPAPAAQPHASPRLTNQPAGRPPLHRPLVAVQCQTQAGRWGARTGGGEGNWPLPAAPSELAAAGLRVCTCCLVTALGPWPVSCFGLYRNIVRCAMAVALWALLGVGHAPRLQDVRSRPFGTHAHMRCEIDARFPQDDGRINKLSHQQL